MRPIERRIEKLETGHSWWREKNARGTLSESDLQLMTDQELLDFIQLTHPDPLAYVAEMAEREEIAHALQQRIRDRQNVHSTSRPH